MLVSLSVLTSCTELPSPGIYQATPAKDVSTNGVVAPVRSDIWEAEVGPTLISVGDTLDMKFPFQPAFNDTYLVGRDGTITLPFLGSIKAADQAVPTLQSAIKSLYANLYQSIPPAANRKYLIGVGDVIDVNLRDQPELNETVTVRPDGKISLPLVHTVVAAGKIPEDLEMELNTHYAKHLSTKPDLVVVMRATKHVDFVVNGRPMMQPAYDLDKVTVTMKAHLPPRIYVGGEVGSPGVKDYAGPVTALQAILSSGGYLRTGELKNVSILRKGRDGQAQFIVCDLKADLAGETVTNDVALRPFDIVVVPKTKIAQIKDFMEQYLYDIIKPLNNSYVGMGFSYTVPPIGSATSTGSTIPTISSTTNPGGGTTVTVR